MTTDRDPTVVRTLLAPLSGVERSQIPAVEIIVFDGIASWLMSQDNPCEDYGEDHAAQLLSVVLGAFGTAPTIEGEVDRAPGDDGLIGIARDRLVVGAHELAAQDEAGATLLLNRAMPALIGELSGHAGEVGNQLRSAFVYPLFAVATGMAERGESDVMRGLLEAFAAWDTQIGDGWVVPWRRS